ncbi:MULTISPECIES: glycoside hydrolase family 27 protein [unclassified Crossiella]|uniref:glycoside hydrolase family 27 protein n=1 Tax=unclassified Crossiella TaxID=2620835 RepID=UPI002000030E|nr:MULTISPECIES: glycoside hydrolase family 27 protein [unclassified Crossiella]MCK2241668.1 glycoside hydrolase family 27 protein [Crossiella sp. S99.2]MCK2255460.1 glycoside hydrolase family 27 protein [Crossiella sp. S99.1]
MRTLLRRGTALAALAMLAATLPAAASPEEAAHTSAAVDQGAPEYYDSGLADTPYMGWNTYYGTGAPTEASIRGVADHMAASGLRDAGYKIIWIDGGWTAPQARNAAGDLVIDPVKFPNGFDQLVEDLHRKGFKAGIYTDAGAWDGKNCGVGSGGYYERDTKQFARWKFDAIKIDFLCGIHQNMKPAKAFAEFSAAVRKAGRPMLLNLCNPVTDAWSVPHGPDQVAGISYSFGPTVADSWRSSTDVAFGTPYEGIWRDMLRNMDDNAAHPEASGPGHFNDPDYLIPMRRTEKGTLELNEEESTTQFVMWAQMAAPLIIGSDPRTLPESMIRTLRNPEILAVNQDRRAIQGVRIGNNGSTDIYSKVLSRAGERSVVLLNRGDQPAEITVKFADAGLQGEVAVRDLRARADRGKATGSYTATVPAHGTAMLKLRGAELAPGDSLGGAASASPALVRFDDATAVAFQRNEHGVLEQQLRTGDKWSQRWTPLGGPTGGRILGQPAAYASAGNRIDVFVRGLDNAAYRRTSRAGVWGPWQRLGGSLTDSPSVAFTSPDNWSLFGRGADGKIWTRTADSAWTSIGAPGDKPTYGRPGAAVVSDGTFVAVRTAEDAVWVRQRDTAGNWGAWTGLGGVISGSPTLLSTQDRIYLFARAGDYTLWQVNRTDGNWGGWFKRTEFASNSVVGAVGAAPGANGSAWLVHRGPDNRVSQSRL